MARGLTSSGNGPLVASTLRWLAALLSPWVGEGEGGDEEACRGEEDEDQGWEVQGWLDEAQRGREEEGGVSVGGPQGWGASSGVTGDGDARGPDDRAADAPPSRIGGGGFLLPPPVDRLGPVYGDGLNGGDKK